MGRPRLTGHELPPRVTFYHGAYYYHPTGGGRKWLGRELGPAMREWTRIVDRPTNFAAMDAVFDRYLIDVTPAKAEATQRDDRRAMPYLRAFFGAMAPEEVDAAAGYAFLEHRGKAAPVRANREFAVLRNVMTYCVRWKLIPANPLYRLQLNPETPRVREVTAREVLAWYRVAGPMLAAYTALKLLIGLRKGDMLRLRKEWWTDEGLFSEIGKSRKRILFERTPALERAVARAIDRCSGPHGTYLFATRAGECYVDTDGETSGFDSIWQRRMARFAQAGHERFTEHDLRSKAGDDAEAAGRAGHRLLGNTEAQFRRAYQRRTQRVQPVR
jgi:integrase